MVISVTVDVTIVVEAFRARLEAFVGAIVAGCSRTSVACSLDLI
jgi:hypothetical protein